MHHILKQNLILNAAHPFFEFFRNLISLENQLLYIQILKYFLPFNGIFKYAIRREIKSLKLLQFNDKLIRH